jgi:hypothetical protein
MSSITIKGEEGKAFGASELAFSEVAASGRLSFRSQAPDDLSFVIEPKLITASGSKIPEVGQRIELFIDGVRHFCGVVTRIPSNWETEVLSVSVTVEGPWWNVEKTPLTELLTETQETERPQFRCEKGNVRNHIIRILQRAKEVGVPIEIGEIAACYDIPTTTFRDGSFAYALSELARLVPDSVIWWDYSGSGNPKFNLSRRDLSKATTFALGADDIASIDLTPELDLKVERVTVESATRAPDGSVQYVSSNAGEGQESRQIITVSGPELAEILPPDPLESVLLSTGGVTSTSDARLTVRRLWEFWIAQELIHGEQIIGLDGFSNFEQYIDGGISDSDYFSGTVSWDNGIAPKWYAEDGSQVISGDEYKYAVIAPNGEVPSWLPDRLALNKGRMTGTWVAKFETPLGVPFGDFAFEAISNANFYRQQAATVDDPLYVWAFFQLDFPVYYAPSLVDDVTYWQAPAYTFEQPPPDYAQNLLAAQNFTPYAGGVDLQLQPGGFVRRTGATLNIEGGLRPWSTMGALVQGETIDLETGMHSLEVGVPGLRSGLNSVSFIKRDPSDNVVLL